MSFQEFDSNNIDDYRDFDFRQIGENEIEVSEQNYRSFPLSIIKQVDGLLNIEVYYEVYMWDNWIRNYSIKKLEKSFSNAFTALQIEGVQNILKGEFDENEDHVLSTWTLKLPLVRKKEEVKTVILKSVDIVLYRTRAQLENNHLETKWSKYFTINEKSYSVSPGIFWVAAPIILSLSFYLGTVKFDAGKINLSEQNIALKDTIRARDNKIKFMRNNSDSAINILGNMPYKEMTLDAQSFRKVQTTIENAGGALYLNR